MKKIITISFALMILFNSTGYFIFHSIYRQHIQSEVKTLLKNSVPMHMLEKIFIPAAELNQLIWTKKHKEFRIKGQMYDVVQTHIQKDGILFICIHDVKESKLFANLDTHIYDYVAHSSEHRNMHLKVFKLFGLNFTFSFNKLVFDLKNGVTIGFPNYALHYSSHESQVDDPPPKA